MYPQYNNNTIIITIIKQFMPETAILAEFPGATIALTVFSPPQTQRWEGVGNVNFTLLNKSFPSRNRPPINHLHCYFIYSLTERMVVFITSQRMHVPSKAFKLKCF
jgi:hypothetical protein